MLHMQGDDSVVECANEGGEIALHMSWNSGKRNIRQPMVRILLFIILKQDTNWIPNSVVVITNFILWLIAKVSESASQFANLKNELWTYFINRSTANKHPMIRIE